MTAESGDTPRIRDAARLRELADELDEMGRGFIEKGTRLRSEAAANRAVAAALDDEHSSAIPHSEGGQ
jgi:hypothetical protein